jgi:tRNA pseudouridine55 synthase
MIDGVIILDKPTGITSNSALQQVKKLFDAQKAGHTGALDPLATGVLPICFGEATKFSKFLLDANKSYIATAKLGVITNSGDSDGEVVEEREVPKLAFSIVEDLINSFKGVSQQTPSMFSALKHEGRPLYEWARKGVEIERKTREITVFSIRLLAMRDDEIDIEVVCSKGTYIRSLVEDIGLKLGCGAHVKMLRRTQAGDFSLQRSVTLDELEGMEKGSANSFKQGDFDTLLLPIDVMLSEYPSIIFDKSQSCSLSHGQSVKIAPPQHEADIVRLYDEQRFLGIGRLSIDGDVFPVRLVVF